MILLYSSVVFDATTSVVASLTFVDFVAGVVAAAVELIDS